LFIKALLFNIMNFFDVLVKRNSFSEQSFIIYANVLRPPWEALEELQSLQMLYLDGNLVRFSAL